MGERRHLGDLLDEERAVLGARVSTTDPAIVEVYGGLGLDFAWIDLEHTGRSPYDSRYLEELTRAADASGIDLLVRLPSGEPPVVRKVLDAGVKTILIPRIESPSDVRRAVRASRFVYEDEPGTYGGGAGRDSSWGDVSTVDPSDHDETVSVGCMIETKSAVDNVDEVVAVPGLDFAFVGPADLSISLGHSLEKDHPDVRRAMEKARDACLDAGVTAGWVTDDTSDAESAIEAGYRLLRIGDEIASVRTVLGSRYEKLRANSD
ncbi:HpcH/HpaI aldolase family protein [Halorussus salinisoli]|uniref:HpcH/HpaI aldolase family protein n=1 Tax=Halorussus salinisoli TaxID=2558242 RepID=UPI0010C1A8C4|nr:aldolase/citrate lyase family protein [Halorussus salinisoli]